MRTVLLLALLQVAHACQAQEPISIFNGVDLTGWEGDSRLWSVAEGAIVGKTSGGQLEQNQFLVWKAGRVEDFRLDVEFQLVGDNNSGIQYRSKLVASAGPYVVQGYQADIHKNASYTAMLYEERGRGILAERGSHIRLDKTGARQPLSKPKTPQEVNLQEWHQLSVTARGNRLIHELDGEVAIDVRDEAPEAAQSGIIALQLHRGPAMTVRFKNLRLTTFGLSESGN